MSDFNPNAAGDDELAAEIDRLAQAELAIHEQKRPLIAEAERRAVEAEARRKYDTLSYGEKAALRQFVTPEGVAGRTD